MERSLEDLVWARADDRCEYCWMPQAFDPLKFQIDHIIANQHLGQTIESNLALACYACNHHKGPNIAGFDLVTQQTVPLFNPRRDVWFEHFAWQGPKLTGLTAIGRVSVHVMAINRYHRVSLRSKLIQEGVFNRDTRSS
jgi:hypothetical protein